MPDSSPLLPDDLRAVLPWLCGSEPLIDPVVHALLYASWGDWAWYVIEFDGDDTLFGLIYGYAEVMGHFSLLAEFSLAEIEGLKGPEGERVERDPHFVPRPLSAIRGNQQAATSEISSDEDQPQGLAAGIPQPPAP